jgi:hypothetical protein
MACVTAPPRSPSVFPATESSRNTVSSSRSRLRGSRDAHVQSLGARAVQAGDARSTHLVRSLANCRCPSVSFRQPYSSRRRSDSGSRSSVRPSAKRQSNANRHTCGRRTKEMRGRPRKSTS